ncbi:MAG: nucleotidyltransferase family protein [Phycisphaerales bacterium]
MSRLDDTIATLRSLMPELRARFGVDALALFGSTARSEDSVASDLDLLVDFLPDARVTLFTLSAMTSHLERTLGRKVDIVENHPRLRPAFLAEIQKDLRRVA